MIECVPCTQGHIDALKPRLREADRIEVTLATGKDPEVCLDESFRTSKKTFAWVQDGQVLCVFGVASQEEGVGIPWLLASDEAVAVGKRLVRYCHEKIIELSAGYRLLHNMTHAENLVAIRWLQWCGFKLHPPVISLYGGVFIPFTMEIKQCALP